MNRRCLQLVAVSLFASIMGAAASVSALTYWPDTKNRPLIKQTPLPMPGYLQPIVDPSLGNHLIRISDAAAFGGYRTSETGLKLLKHHYSKDSAWNADETLIYLLGAKNPGVLLDGGSYKFIGYLPISPFNKERVWSNVHPDLMVGVRDNPAEIGTLNVRTGASAIIAAFPHCTSLSLGAYEGNLSNDDRLACLIGQRGADLDILSYDLTAKTVLGTLTLPNATTDFDIDFCTATPSGKYIAIGFSHGSAFGYPDSSLQIYDTAMHHLRQMPGTSSHVDFTYDMSGDEVVVGSHSSTGDISHQYVYSARLSDGHMTVQLPPGSIDNPTHTSCRATLRPGWCYISEFASTDASHPVTYYNTYFNYNEIVAVKLDGSGAIERVAKEHHVTDPSFDYNANDGYDRCAMAVPSRKGDRVLFASDWGDPSRTAFVHAYVSWWRAAALSVSAPMGRPHRQRP
jgi:hypothetical protein